MTRGGACDENSSNPPERASPVPSAFPSACFTGLETFIEKIPSPDALWSRLQGAESPSSECLLTPANLTDGKEPRYYQRIAIDRTIQAILDGKRRNLLTMATGTGITDDAFQICWKLWSAR